MFQISVADPSEIFLKKPVFVCVIHSLDRQSRWSARAVYSRPTLILPSSYYDLLNWQVFIYDRGRIRTFSLTYDVY
jgi:hypothetical protein